MHFSDPVLSCGSQPLLTEPVESNHQRMTVGFCEKKPDRCVDKKGRKKKQCKQ